MCRFKAQIAAHSRSIAKLCNNLARNVWRLDGAALDVKVGHRHRGWPRKLAAEPISNGEQAEKRIRPLSAGPYREQVKRSRTHERV